MRIFWNIAGLLILSGMIYVILILISDLGMTK